MFQSEEFREGYGFMDKCLDLLGTKRKSELISYEHHTDRLKAGCNTDFFSGAFAWRVFWMLYLTRRRDIQ